MPLKKKGLTIEKPGSGANTPRGSSTPRAGAGAGAGAGGGVAATPKGAKGKGKSKIAESPANKGATALPKEVAKVGPGTLEEIENELKEGVIVGGGLKLFSGGDDGGISMMDATSLIAKDELSQPQSQTVQKMSVWNKIQGLKSSIRIMTAKDQVSQMVESLRGAMQGVKVMLTEYDKDRSRVEAQVRNTGILEEMEESVNQVPNPQPPTLNPQPSTPDTGILEESEEERSLNFSYSTSPHTSQTPNPSNSRSQMSETPSKWQDGNELLTKTFRKIPPRRAFQLEFQYNPG